MKRRYRYLLNFFSIGLLLIALYLNFVKKEAAEFAEPAGNGSTTSPLKQDAKESKTLTAKQSERTVDLK